MRSSEDLRTMISTHWSLRGDATAFVIFKLISRIWLVSILSICSEIAPQVNITDEHSTLVHVMAWCRQATSHCPNQSWPHGVNKSQWVNAKIDDDDSDDVLVDDVDVVDDGDSDDDGDDDDDDDDDDDNDDDDMLSLQMTIRDIVATDDDPWRRRYKWRSVTLSLQMTIRDVVATNEDPWRCRYRWRSVTLWLQMAIRDVVATDDDPWRCRCKWRSVTLSLQMTIRDVVATDGDPWRCRNRWRSVTLWLQMAIRDVTCYTPLQVLLYTSLLQFGSANGNNLYVSFILMIIHFKTLSYCYVLNQMLMFEFSYPLWLNNATLKNAIHCLI